MKSLSSPTSVFSGERKMNEVFKPHLKNKFKLKRLVASKWKHIPFEEKNPDPNSVAGVLPLARRVKYAEPDIPE